MCDCDHSVDHGGAIVSSVLVVPEWSPSSVFFVPWGKLSPRKSVWLLLLALGGVCLLTASSLWDRSAHVRFADGRPAGFEMPKLHVVPAAAQRLHLADIPGVS